ncbi:MFS general substrate transporter [Pseudomassariella vexata]|uniref:MFS general substrate transporter n=1 Tax=Pseudomassariella vexata TaxID=1141098 RepID=A0A1Y2E8T5_9PEZI|nr:MFS general substrate transporter [Pseudomassariella vexata]ORY67724.1 MFS general substrate transporter [Pseudomassariella vexata]
MPFGKENARDIESANEPEEKKQGISKWNMGMLNDKQTIEVPGSVLLLAKDYNQPLGLRNTPARSSQSSLPTGIPVAAPSLPAGDDTKKTKDGQIILEPQPDDSCNDPLNWPAWRRDLALVSLGLYCMVGGGITPLLASGFTNIAEDYDIELSQVSLTTGLYMLGLGIGCVIFSPTAILFGKRPVYLFSAIIFILSSIWCALSPSFTSLILARVFQGIAVSPVEALPSATIAEIFFLHERAFRIGIYTLLLLGGKNLIPLVSAAIIQSLSWRWVFWIVAMLVGFCGILLFLFVPETFWDRSPVPRSRQPSRRPSLFRRKSSATHFIPGLHRKDVNATHSADHPAAPEVMASEGSTKIAVHPHQHKNVHVGFASDSEPEHGHQSESDSHPVDLVVSSQPKMADTPEIPDRKGSAASPSGRRKPRPIIIPPRPMMAPEGLGSSIFGPPMTPAAGGLFPPTPDLRNFNSPYYERISNEYFESWETAMQREVHSEIGSATRETHSEKMSIASLQARTGGQAYTHALRHAPPQSFHQQLRIYHCRLSKDRWWKVCIRPFILFAYPAVLWSAAIYAFSIGWLIVISESVAVIFREGTYHFSALATGLIYLSPFIGGILGSAVAGKVSDIVIQFMARRNGGLYEPEFRLLMAFPVAITTVIGLVGFGWSASVNDPWIVPTLFFGIVSFGCSLGSTTAITFCVDSYRQYAGEALVTLNFSKNVLHGLVFSLFVTGWLTHDGPKTVFVWIGVMQLIVLCSTVPMYIFGKRARMWTVRRNFMEKF